MVFLVFGAQGCSAVVGFTIFNFLIVLGVVERTVQQNVSLQVHKLIKALTSMSAQGEDAASGEGDVIVPLALRQEKSQNGRDTVLIVLV